MTTERFLERLASADANRPAEGAPARLKARIYSSLIHRLSATGTLLSLSATKAQGAGLCIFEEAIAMLPVSEGMKSINPCSVCHARLLAEWLEAAPIFWPHCPYSEFHHPKK